MSPVPVDVVAYVMARVLEDNPEASPAELVTLQAQALRAAGLVEG